MRCGLPLLCHYYKHIQRRLLIDTLQPMEHPTAATTRLKIHDEVRIATMIFRSLHMRESNQSL